MEYLSKCMAVERCDFDNQFPRFIISPVHLSVFFFLPRTCVNGFVISSLVQHLPKRHTHR